MRIVGLLRILQVLSCFIVGAALGLAPGAARAAQTLHGHVPGVTARLTPIGRLPATQKLSLAIALPLRNRQALTNLLDALYDPASPSYRQYLSPEQFAQQFGPAPEDYQALISFAQSNGFAVTATHPNRTLLSVNASVGDIERAFHLTMRMYQHPTENHTFYAPDAEPSLDFATPVLDISGLDNFSPPRPAGLHPVPAGKPGTVTPNNGSAPGGSFMGNDFRAAYAPGVALNGAGQMVGLLQFDGYYTSDITAYETQAGLPNVPLQNVLLDGLTGSAGANNSEVALDIEMSISMAPGLSKVLVYEGSLPNDILNRMATDNLAKQLSSSWTWSPFSSSTDQIFQQFAAQGQSFFNAAGDNDAYTSTIDTPSDDAYVVSVGGTTLSTTGPGGSWVSETVWNWGNGTGTGGGISTAYTLPTWQQGVSMTLNQGSTSMRNIPDVAMCADNVYVRYNNGSAGTFGGTSCASPLWAGFTALINQQAVANGVNTVGFLNPAFYSLGKGSTYTTGFHDVTTGNNTSTTSPSRFYGIAGYDLCTGWGTPSGSGLITALAGVAAPSLTSNGVSLVSETCVNGAVDPNETVTMNFGLKNTGGASTTNLVATLLATGGVVSPGTPQVYGALAGGGGTASMPFIFTANGTCGGTITATLQLHDGTANLGSVNFVIPLGQNVSVTNFGENFDGVTPPSLPAGWAAANLTGTQNDWSVANTAFDTAPNAAFVTDSANPGENALVSPVIAIASAAAQLTFRHNYNLEFHTPKHGTTTYFDGSVLEIQIGGGGFTDILSAGGSFASGGYNGAVTTTSDNPLTGRQAWVGNASGWVTTIVNLPASAAGQNVQFRWVCGTDTANNYGGVGWYVDSVIVADNSIVCCTPTVTVAPSISSQPSGQVVAPGNSATFSVTATGTPAPGYQWTLNGTNLPGDTARTLNLNNVQPAQAGNYAVAVTNSAGSVTSAIANLKVIRPPLLTSTSGTPFHLTLTSATGVSYTIEYKNSLTDSNWTPLSSAVAGTGGTLNFQDTNAPFAKRFYRVRCQ